MVKVPKFLGLVALGLLSFMPVSAEISQESLTRRIIAFAPGTPAAERLAVAKATGGRIVRELKLIDAVVVEMPASRISAAEMNLRKNEKVLRVDEDPYINWLESAPRTLHDIALPDVTQFLKQARSAQDNLPTPPEAPAPAQSVPWGIKRVNAAGAWAVTRGQGVKVAIIDTGVDRNHPDLKDNVVGGWNAITKGDDFMDDHGHGTHVTGTIGALDNDLAVVGVAPSAALYGVKVLDANGSGTFDDVIAGMEWCVTNKMQVANMSLGASRGNPSLQAAVEKMTAAGVAVIAAAGNSGRAVGYPAAYPDAIAIAASDSGDKVAYFSSRGPEVDFIAPGVSVDSLAPGGGTDNMSGTSMATPHAAGLAALAIAAKGTTTVAQLRKVMEAASTPFAGVPVEQQGAGFMDAAKLVK